MGRQRENQVIAPQILSCSTGSLSPSLLLRMEFINIALSSDFILSGSFCVQMSLCWLLRLGGGYCPRGSCCLRTIKSFKNSLLFFNPHLLTIISQWYTQSTDKQWKWKTWSTHDKIQKHWSDASCLLHLELKLADMLEIIKLNWKAKVVLEKKVIWDWIPISYCQLSCIKNHLMPCGPTALPSMDQPIPKFGEHNLPSAKIHSHPQH